MTRKLVLHHRYTHGMAWDLSGLDNHGTTRDVSSGSGALTGSLLFHQPSSRIDVRRGPSLDPTGAFRCSVRFWLTGDKSKRYNLVESQLSFAFFIEKGYRIAATILDANGQWTGAFSGGMQPLTARAGWHRADCGHDGVSTSWVAFDGQVVAVNDNVPGPVRPCGPRGLTVGHWPEPFDAYAFEGNIAEVWLWYNRPDPPVDDCCVDRGAIAEAEQLLRERGWDLAEVRRRLDAVRAVASEVRGFMPGSVGAAYDRDGARLGAAVKGNDWREVGVLSRQIRTMVEGAVPGTDQDRLTGDLLDVFADVIGDPELVGAAVRALLCDPGAGGRPGGGGKPDDRDGWPHWGPELDPSEDVDHQHPPDEAPPDVGYPPGDKPAEKPSETGYDEKGEN